MTDITAFTSTGLSVKESRCSIRTVITFVLKNFEPYSSLIAAVIADVNFDGIRSAVDRESDFSHGAITEVIIDPVGEHPH